MGLTTAIWPYPDPTGTVPEEGAAHVCGKTIHTRPAGGFTSWFEVHRVLPLVARSGWPLPPTV